MIVISCNMNIMVSPRHKSYLSETINYVNTLITLLIQMVNSGVICDIHCFENLPITMYSKKSRMCYHFNSVKSLIPACRGFNERQKGFF